MFFMFFYVLNMILIIYIYIYITRARGGVAGDSRWQPENIKKYIKTYKNIKQHKKLIKNIKNRSARSTFSVYIFLRLLYLRFLFRWVCRLFWWLVGWPQLAWFRLIGFHLSLALLRSEAFCWMEGRNVGVGWKRNEILT